jgi:hypothetical protein
MAARSHWLTAAALADKVTVLPHLPVARGLPGWGLRRS